MTPLKTLVLGVFAASSLSAFALGHVAKKELTWAFGEAALVDGSVYAAKNNYREVINAMEQASSKPAPNIEPTIR